MLNPYFTQKNYIPLETVITWVTQGYSSMGIDVTGTFTSGSFILEGSNDGATWTTLNTANADGIVTDGIISTTGHYIFDILGFNQVRYTPTSVVGTLVLSTLGTVEVAPAFTGVSPVDPVFPGIENSVLITDSTGHVEGAPFGAVGDVFVMSATGSLTLNSIVTSGANLFAISTGGAVLKSTDNGATFSQVATVTGANFIFYGNSLFIIGCTGGAIYTSTDGATWTLRTSGVVTNLDCCVWTGTSFVVGGQTGTILTSPTGTTWTARTFGSTVEVWGIAWSGSVLVASGSNMIRTSDATAVTWAARTPAFTDRTWDVLWDSTNSQFVGVANAGKIQTSPTGTTWTAQTSGVSTALYSIAGNASALVAVGASGVILTSPTGATWTPRTSGVTTDLLDSVLQSTSFYAVGNAGAVVKSTDNGATWSLLTNPGPVFQATLGAGALVRAPGLTGTGNVVTAAGASTFTDARTFTSVLTGTASNWSGSVGIGVTGAAQQLEIGAAAYTSKIRFTNTAGGGYLTDWGYKSNGDGNKIFLTITDGGVSLDVLSVMYDGVITIPALAGTGTRPIVASASGVLSAPVVASGTFLSADAKTVTVTNGLIASIV